MYSTKLGKVLCVKSPKLMSSGFHKVSELMAKFVNTVYIYTGLNFFFVIMHNHVCLLVYLLVCFDCKIHINPITTKQLPFLFFSQLFRLDIITSKVKASGLVPDCPVPQSAVVMSKECQSKIRYLAGWVVFKEQEAASRYIRLNSGSTNVKVKNRVQKELAIRELLVKLTTQRCNIVCNTSYPSSISHIERYNHGALVHVKDDTFLFTLKLEEACSQHFTEEMAHKYKWKAVSVARANIKQDAQICLLWEKLINQG